MSIEFKKVARIIPPPPAGTETDVFYNMQSDFGGYIYRSDPVSWSSCRDNTTGNGTSTNIHYTSVEYDLGTTPPRYAIERSFIDIDLSGIHQDAVITSGTLRCHMWDYQTFLSGGGAYVNLQQGTHGTGKGFTISDYDAFTGASFGTGTFYDNYRPYYIELNQDGLDYLNANIGSTVKFCIREKPHDYDDSAPDGSETFANARFYTYSPPSEDGYTHSEYKPLLTLKYEIPWEYEAPASTTSTFYIDALGGPGGTNYNHDLRMVRTDSSDNTWAGARDAASADSISSGYTSSLLVQASRDGKGIPYYVRRGHLSFDLGEMNNTQYKDITAARLVIQSNGYGAPSGIPQMDVFQGTWDYLVTASGFAQFTGTSLLTVPATWAAGKNNVTLTFNQDGIDYIKDNMGGMVSFCFREYAHDVANVAPPNPGDNWYMYINAAGPLPELQVDYTEITETS